MSTLFTPSTEEVRRFFLNVWETRDLRAQPLTPIELIAQKWLRAHPEYHEVFDKLLANPERIKNDNHPAFLHLSLHLAFEEQVQADQPKGISKIYQTLCVKAGDEHKAAHVGMDILGNILWSVQRSAAPPDMNTINSRYLDMLHKATITQVF